MSAPFWIAVVLLVVGFVLLVLTLVPLLGRVRTLRRAVSEATGQLTRARSLQGELESLEPRVALLRQQSEEIMTKLPNKAH